MKVALVKTAINDMSPSKMKFIVTKEWKCTYETYQSTLKILFSSCIASILDWEMSSSLFFGLMLLLNMLKSIYNISVYIPLYRFITLSSIIIISFIHGIANEVASHASQF